MGVAVAVAFFGNDPQARLIGTASGVQRPSLLQRDGFVALTVDDEEVRLRFGEIVERGNRVEIQPVAAIGAT